MNVPPPTNANNPYAAIGVPPSSYGSAIPQPPPLIQPVVNSSIPGTLSNVPNKPLFPCVSNTGSDKSSSTTVVGADFKPIPSGSNSISSTTTSTTNQPPPLSSGIIAKPASSVASTGTTSKIIHPEEDISLEELRARLTKYIGLIPQQLTTNNMAGDSNTFNSNHKVDVKPAIPPPAPPYFVNVQNKFL